jgi:hypothetical protein
LITSVRMLCLTARVRDSDLHMLSISLSCEQVINIKYMM